MPLPNSLKLWATQSVQQWTQAAKREVIHSNQQKPNFLGSTMYKKKDVSGQFVLKSDLEKGYYKIE